MTNQTPSREPGYRGSLPPRNDGLAKPWVVTVIVIFVLIILLAFAGLPSRLFPGASPEPIPSIPIPSFSGSPAGSPLVSPGAS